MSHARIHTFHATYSRIHHLSCDATRVESEIAYTRLRDTCVRRHDMQERKMKQWVIFLSCLLQKKTSGATTLTNYCKYEFMRKMSTVTRECIWVPVRMRACEISARENKRGPYSGSLDSETIVLTSWRLFDVTRLAFDEFVQDSSSLLASTITTTANDYDQPRIANIQWKFSSSIISLSVCIFCVVPSQ